ncbi:MAG: AMP-binding protein [Spirochaetales bacterium]|nr:AMP-binding protein [Spirochaetales bacterium]
MKNRTGKDILEHFKEDRYNFEIIRNNLKSCHSRGIHILDDQVNEIGYYTYSEIYKKAGNCAQKLNKLGIEKNTRVLLSAQTDIRFVITWLALIQLGAIPATLPPRSAFFSRDIYINRIREIIPFFNNFICYDNEVPYIQNICEDRNHQINLIVIGNLFSESSPQEDQDNPAPENIPLYNDTAFIQFTSGSMSTPKGIIITFKNLLNNIRGIYTRLELNPETTIIGNWLPLYHDMGLAGFFLLSLFTQSTLLMVSPISFIKRMANFMRLISTYKITVSCMTNTVLDIILHRYKEDDYKDISLDSLTWLGVGAEPINIKTLENFQTIFKKHGLKENVVSPCYGLAESTLAVSMVKSFEGYSVSTINGRSFPTVGTIIEGTEVKLDTTLSYSGVGGVIKIRGDSVSTHSIVKGKRIKKTDDDGFYNTKDIGYFVGDKLVILGRADTMFIVNGENFFSHEVESLLINSRLLQRPNVTCIPITYSDPDKNTGLVVIYEVNGIKKEEKLKLDEQLASLIIKNTGLVIDKFVAAKRGSILYTTSGKIQYNTMRNLYERGDISDYFRDDH